MFLDICEKSSVLNIILFIKSITYLIGVIIPFILIVASSIELYKITISKDVDSIKNYKKILYKFIAAACLFFVPLLANVIIALATGQKIFDNKCWSNADYSTVNYYKDLENKQEIEEQDKKDKEKEESDEERESVEEIREKARKENEKKAAEAKKKSLSKLDYSNSIEVPNSVLKNGSHSNLSIVVVDENGVVLAHKNPNVQREGASTSKIFTGYAAVKLLDPTTDKVVCTKYAQNMKYMGTPDVKVGQVFTVSQAATRDFPGSSNITTANIAIAIGKKYYNTKSDEEAYFNGLDKINEYIKSIGCSNTRLPSSSGVNYDYKVKKFVFDSNGFPKGNYGVTANDLGIVTILAMKDTNFSKGINYGKNGICPPPDSNSFYIKSGTQAYCHGVWGFNYNSKRYYVVILGVNCNKGDNKCTLFKDIYNWSKKELIK